MKRWPRGVHGFQIGGNRPQIVVRHVLKAVLDRLGHRSGGLRLAGDTPGFQIGRDLFIRPASDAMDRIAGDIRRIPRADRAAAQILPGYRQIGRAHV